MGFLARLVENKFGVGSSEFGGIKIQISECGLRNLEM